MALERSRKEDPELRVEGSAEKSPLRPGWQVELEGLLSQACYCVRELQRDRLTSLAVQELEATLKESRGKLYEFLDQRVGRVVGVARYVKIEKRPGVDWDQEAIEEETEVDEKEYYLEKKKEKAQRIMARVLGEENKS